MTPPGNCNETQTLKLQDIYRNPPKPTSPPIDEGGIQALKQNSDAYLHLNKTDISSYVIIGNWKPNTQINGDSIKQHGFLLLLHA